MNSFSDFNKSRNNSSWEVQKNNITDLKLPTAAMNIKRSDASILIIYNIASTICMNLRLRQLTEKQNMDFKFPPLVNQHWPIHKRRRFEEINEFEALDAIIYSIDSELTESNEAKPRTSLIMRHNSEDDEGICDLLSSRYLDETCRSSKKYLKTYKKKVGRLFAASLDFIRRNRLTFKMFSRQTCPLMKTPNYHTNFENIAQELSRKRPNYRISILSVLGFYETKNDEDVMDKARREVFDAIYREEQAAFDVSFKIT